MNSLKTTKLFFFSSYITGLESPLCRDHVQLVPIHFLMPTVTGVLYMRSAGVTTVIKMRS